MEQEILTILQNIGWAGAIALVGYLLINKVLAPLVHYFINKKNGVPSDLDKRITKVENHDLHDINRRLTSLEASDIRIENRVNKMAEDLAFLRARINGK